MNENKGKFAYRNIYVIDQGHYGSTTCSLCGVDVEKHFDYCPSCGAKFISENISMNLGGSDF